MGRLHRSRLRRWQVLKLCILDNEWRKGAELGVYKGDTFRYLVKQCPDLELVGVDLFNSGHHESTRDGRPPLKKRPDLAASEKALRAWIRQNAPKRAKLIRSDTVKAASRFDDGSFDFVFVDADHRYESVQADIAAWRPKIRDGGWMMGHDYNDRDFPGVVQAVGEAFGQPTLHSCDIWSVVC